MNTAPTFDEVEIYVAEWATHSKRERLAWSDVTKAKSWVEHNIEEMIEDYARNEPHWRKLDNGNEEWELVCDVDGVEAMIYNVVIRDVITLASRYPDLTHIHSQTFV